MKVYSYQRNRVRPHDIGMALVAIGVALFALAAMVWVTLTALR